MIRYAHLILPLLHCVAAFAGEPVQNGFTYQGQLKDAGVPLNGNVDLRFELFDADAGGNPIGSLLQIDDVPVVNGLFALELDFGSDVFRNQAVWLDVSVRNPSDATDATPFTLLTPRQPVTAVPKALVSLAPWAESADGVSYLGGNVGIGTDQPTRLLDLRHASVGEISLLGSGEGNISRLTLGQDAANNVRLQYDGQFDRLDFIPEDGAGFPLPSLSIDAMNNDVLLIPFGAGNVGVGTLTPDVPLHVDGGTDASPSGGGYIQTGNTSGANVVIDENEIMARNDGFASDLHINEDGGAVIVGLIDIGLELVEHTSVAEVVSACCPAGKQAIGGGCEPENSNDPITRSAPFSGLTCWGCTFDTGTLGIGLNTAYAICARVRF